MKHTYIHRWGRKEELLQLTQRDSLWEPEPEKLRKDSLAKLHGLSLKDELTTESKDECFLQDSGRYICKHFPAAHDQQNITSMIYLSYLFPTNVTRRQHEILLPDG